MLTQSQIKNIYTYNQKTGDFIRLNSSYRNAAKAGSVAGTIRKNGYVQIYIAGKLYYAHSLAWLYMTGYLPKFNIDHIDHNRSNNKWGNLRACETKENAMNASLSKSNKTGFNGVCFSEARNSYRATVTVNRKHIFLGWFSNICDAINARKLANIEYGFHENHGVK